MDPAAEPGLWGTLDGGWNARDFEYRPGLSKVLHYTTLHLQPWRPTPEQYSYHAHPLGMLWLRLEREADAQGYQPFTRERPSSAYRRLLAERRAPLVPAAPAALPSQDYLYEMGETLFGETYLHIASHQDDVTQASVTGLNVFAGLGPYTLVYPFTDYSDQVRPDRDAEVAFEGPGGVTGISYAGASFKTVFLGFPLEAVPEAGRRATLGMLIEFFGGCEAICSPVAITSLTSNSPVQLGDMMSFSATVTGTEPVVYTWDFGGTGTVGGTGANVTFLYDAAGLYTGTLDVENACPSSDTDTLQVEVLEPPVYQIIYLPVLWKTP